MTQDATIDAQKIVDSLTRLLAAREKLLTQELAPVDTWIHEYSVKKIYPSGFIGEYKYAKWMSSKPIFERSPKKHALPLKRGKDPKYTHHRHIGRIWSNTGLGMEPETSKAYQMLRNRKRLEAIENALAEIQRILSQFE